MVLLPLLSTGGAWSSPVVCFWFFFPLIKPAAPHQAGGTWAWGLSRGGRIEEAGRSQVTWCLSHPGSAAQLWVSEGLQGSEGSASRSPELRHPGSAGPARLPPHGSLHSRAVPPRGAAKLARGWAYLETSILPGWLQPPPPPLQKPATTKKALLGSGSLPSCFNQGKNVPLRTPQGYGGFGKQESSSP